VAEVGGVELGVVAAAGDQLVVRAFLDDPAFAQDDDTVGG
jgi:hypothetical protein